MLIESFHKKSDTFLYKEEVISRIIDDCLVDGFEVAHDEFHAKNGALGGCLVLDGIIQNLKVVAINGNVADSSRIGVADKRDINYLGFALMKLSQSIRTGRDSQSCVALEAGEADCLGSVYLTFEACDVNGNKTEFSICFVFSGLPEAEKDMHIASKAMQAAIRVLREIAEFYGVKISVKAA